MIDDEVATVLAAAPEFSDRYLELIESADGDPGAAAAFAELADFVAGLVAGLVAEAERVRLPLQRCLAGVERVAETSDDAEELIVWSFFDNLSPDDVRHLDRWLGPRTRALLDDVDLAPSAPGTYGPDTRIGDPVFNETMEAHDRAGDER